MKITAETLRIEIPIETIDNTDPELSTIILNFKRMEKAAKEADGAAKKADGTVTQFDRQAQKTEKSLAKWAKEKYEIMLEAKDRIKPVLFELGGRLKGFAGKTWSVTMKAVDLITSPVRGIINLLKNPVFQVGAVLGVSIGLKDTIDTYKDFEAAMSQVQAISGATGSEVTKLNNKAKEMGATTKFTAEESAEAFNYMAMAGWKTNDMLNGIEGILNLASSSGEDLATTSDIVTDALTAFGLKASASGHFADVLAQASSNANTNVSMLGESFKYIAPVAGAMKYNVEDVSLALGLMANASVKGSMAGTSLKTALVNMTSPTDKMASAMKKYGISLKDNDGKMKTLKEVMDNLRESLGGLTEAEQTAAASRIFGKEAMAGMLSIINASEKDYNKLAEAVNNADGAAKNMSDTMLDNLKGSITILQSAVDGVKISFGERLSPYVRSLADWLTDQMPEVEQGLDELIDWVDTKVSNMKRKFSEIVNTKEWQNADFLGKVKIAWDEFIAEPFSEWWNSTGKAKFAVFAQDIGTGIGTGLKTGIMTLLGIDVGEILDEGVSIGASFAKGFSEGFDFEAVSEKLFQGFGDLVSSAGKLLPGGEEADLSSVMSAVVLGKMAMPFMSMGKGAVGIGKSLFGTNAATGTSLMGSFLGSAATGTGLFGKSAMFAMNLGAGNLAGGASMSAGALSAAGLGSAAGGIAGAASLISGFSDWHTAVKNQYTDKEKADVYQESGSWKIGGTAAGAATGAALGSVIPGIGTAVGALIGAGVGGIAGWIKGNKVKKEYQQRVEEMQEEEKKAEKVFQATGMSIEDVTFKNEALTKAMNDSEVSAEQFAVMFQEECVNVAKSAFGDITLSLAEIKKAAGEITFANKADELSEFMKTTSDTEKALNNLQASFNALKKENWKVGLGMKLSAEDKDNYKNAIKDFIDSSQTFIDDNHYEAVVALKLLTGNEADTSGVDTFYGGMNEQVADLSKQLNSQMKISLKDGVITLDEASELENLQNQITEITSKLTDAKTDAEMQSLKIKYDGAALDADSFNALQEELQANVASASEQYESALTVTLTNLNLQLADGVITQSEYDKAVSEATEGYYAQIDELNARVSSFNLESIASAWDSGLEDFMPYIEGSTTEKLSQALNKALLIQPDVSAWTPEELAGWIGLDKTSLDTTEQTVIAAELIQTALAIPEGTKEKIIQNFKEQIPSLEEMQTAIADKGPVSNEYYEQMIEQYTTDFSNALAGAEYGSSGMSIASGIGSSIMNADMSEINSAIDALKSNTDSSVNTAFSAGVNTTMPVNVTLDYNVTNPSKTFSVSGKGVKGSTDINVTAHAAGGYVSGGPQLSWLAEEGYGEFVIPTNPSRRSRALDLYEQAGEALGVSAHAAGGYVGGSILSNKATDYNLSSDAERNAPIAYNETTEDNYNDDSYDKGGYEPVYSGENNNSSSAIQVNVSVAPEFVINGGNGQDEESIMKVIRRHIKEMADELGGEIAGKLEEVFSNMPLKEAEQ